MAPPERATGCGVGRQGAVERGGTLTEPLDPRALHRNESHHPRLELHDLGEPPFGPAAASRSGTRAAQLVLMAPQVARPRAAPTVRTPERGGAQQAPALTGADARGSSAEDTGPSPFAFGMRIGRPSPSLRSSSVAWPRQLSPPAKAAVWLGSS